VAEASTCISLNFGMYSLKKAAEDLAQWQASHWVICPFYVRQTLSSAAVAQKRLCNGRGSRFINRLPRKRPRRNFRLELTETLGHAQSRMQAADDAVNGWPMPASFGHLTSRKPGDTHSLVVSDALIRSRHAKIDRAFGGKQS